MAKPDGMCGGIPPQKREDNEAYLTAAAYLQLSQVHSLN